MKFKNYFFLLLILIWGCNEKIPKDFKITKYHENGEINTIEKEIGDTLIEGNTFKKTYIISYTEKGKIEREGRYINYNAYGDHYFYDENQNLNCIRNYHIWTKDEKQLIISAINFDTAYINNLRNEITFLNSVYYLDDNSDTLDKSSYVKIELDKNSVKVNEEVNAKLTFFEGNYKIDFVNLLFNYPADTSLVVTNGTRTNVCYQKQVIDKVGETSISGIAFIGGYIIGKSNDTIPTGRTTVFEKKYFVVD